MSRIKYILEFEANEITRCDECQFCDLGQHLCTAADNYFDDDIDCRMIWCPLKKVGEVKNDEHDT